MATLKERRELIERLKVPGREKVAGRKEDAFKWLKEWQNQNGVGPGVIPLEEHIPMHHRPFILRRASTTPRRDSLRAEIPNWSTGGGLGPEAKRRLLDEEYQNDVIKRVLDGTMSSSDGAQILQLEESEFQKLMNELVPLPELENDSPDLKKLLIAPYNDTNWR